MESEGPHAPQSKLCTIGFTFETGYYYGVSSCRHHLQCLMCITPCTWWLENTCGLTLWYWEVETSARQHSGHVCKSLGCQLGSFTLSPVIHPDFHLLLSNSWRQFCKPCDLINPGLWWGNGNLQRSPPSPCGQPWTFLMGLPEFQWF